MYLLCVGNESDSRTKKGGGGSKRDRGRLRGQRGGNRAKTGNEGQGKEGTIERGRKGQKRKLGERKKGKNRKEY